MSSLSEDEYIEFGSLATCLKLENVLIEEQKTPLSKSSDEQPF